MAETTHTVLEAPEPGLIFAEFYDATLASPEVAVYVIRVGDAGEFTFEDANEVVALTAGRPLSDIRGRTPEEVLLPEVADCITTNLRTCVETGLPMAYQRTFEFPTGRVSFKTNLMPIVRGSRGTKYVLGFTRDVTNEINLIESAQHQAALLRALGIALPSAVYLLDMEQQRLQFIGGDVDNHARLTWRKEAESTDRPSSARFFHPEDWPRVEAHWAELALLADGQVFTISYRFLGLDGEYRRHVNREIVFSRDADGKVKLVLGVSEDVSEHDKIEQEARDLSAHMLTLQIEQRRRIAQELHDSTGQHLTAAGLALGNARALRCTVDNGDKGQEKMLAAIDEAAGCVREAQSEIRVLSFLLHPPHLRSGGLADALRDFAIGFGQRSGLKMSVDIALAADAIEDDVAVHLFRVCQEALTNVYRHATAHKAQVTLEVADTIRLTVKDDGVGFDASAEDTILGVGVPGMRDRMARLGGAVHIQGDPGGTTLVATLPLGEPKAAHGLGRRAAQ